jgi:hypothetical protein
MRILIFMHRASTPFAHIDFSSKIEAIYNLFANCIMPSLTEVGPLGPLPLIGQYKKHSDITYALQAHACENGYAITVNKTTPTVGAWICSKGGKYNP